MKIKRILNNNAVVVKSRTGEEKIVLGPGVAFGKKKNDRVSLDKVEKVFVIHDEVERNQFADMVRDLPKEHVEIADAIIERAKTVLGVPLSEHIHVALTDHLSFALERIKKGIDIQNQLMEEIRTFYPREYEVARWARQQIRERTGVKIPEDEVAFIALHLHTAAMNSSMVETMKWTEILKDMIRKIEKGWGIKLERDSIAHQRLLTHLRFALKRLQRNEPFIDMDREMTGMIREKYPRAWEVADRVCAWAEEEHGVRFPEAERAYIALHLQRIHC